MIVACPDCKKTLIEFDVGSGNYHCSNPSCTFQYIEIMTGKQHRKASAGEGTGSETDNLDKKPKRILVGLAIESTLLNMGHTIFDEVTTKLREEYDASVFDCLESPQYLKKILEKNFDGHVKEVAIKSIRTVLGEFAYYASVREFLDELSGKN